LPLDPLVLMVCDVLPDAFVLGDDALDGLLCDTYDGSVDDASVSYITQLACLFDHLLAVVLLDLCEVGLDAVHL